MYDRFKWSSESLVRNRLLQRYEPLQPAILRTLAERFECDTFLDIGANIGTYSLFISDVVRTVHAFEPSAETYRHLTQNIAINGLGAKVTAHKQAVSDATGNVPFGEAKTLGGNNSIIETSIHSADTFKLRTTVPAVVLDEYLLLKGTKLCIKVDIEGHEPKAIAGMRRTLTENEVILQIEEYGDHQLTQQLAGLGLKPAFRVGPDRYFANFDISAEIIVEVFEKSSAELIRALLKHSKESGAISIPLVPGVRVQLGGRIATAARRARGLISNSGGRS